MFTPEKIENNVYLLKVPFGSNYTSVFLLTGSPCAVIDCATTASDVDNVIVPALELLGVTPEYLLISHTHGDHFGGHRRMTERYPSIKVGLFDEKSTAVLGDRAFLLNDGDTVAGVKVLHLAGHTSDSAGFLTAENTLLSCDCLQLWGICSYGCSTDCPDEYLDSLVKVRTLHPDRIVTSHCYYSLGQTAVGDWVDRYLDQCLEAVTAIRDFLRTAQTDDCKQLQAEFALSHPAHPTLSPNMIKRLYKVF